MDNKSLKIKVQNLDEQIRIDSYIYNELGTIAEDLTESSTSLDENFDDGDMDESISLSRSKIQFLIKSNKILLNDKTTKKNIKVKNGDIINLTIEEKEPMQVIAEDIPIDIVYEDDDIIIVNKARGMVVHPAPKNYSGTLVNAILFHLNQKNENNFIDSSSIRPGIVHRIDKDTTGILMIAKNDYAQMFLSEQLRNRTVNRRYIALVHGGFTCDEGSIDIPIARHKKDRLKMAVDINGKKAITNYKVLEKIGNYSLLEFKLETGRTHQIRVHTRYIKHPIVGDPIYGAKNCKYNHVGQLLHAKSLGFIHPRTKKYIEFNSDLPEDFKKILNEVKIKNV